MRYLLYTIIFFVFTHSLNAQYYEKLDTLFYKNYKLLSEPEKFDPYVDSVIKFHFNCQYDLDGIPIDTISKLSKQNSYVGLGCPDELYLDTQMRASFDFYHYPLSKKNRDMIMIYLNGHGTFVDQVYFHFAIFEKTDSIFRNNFNFRGKILGYYPDSSFILKTILNCDFAQYRILHMKQSEKSSGFDTLDHVIHYYTWINDKKCYKLNSLNEIKRISVKKGTDFYAFPTKESFTGCIPIIIAKSKIKIENVKVIDIHTDFTGKWIGVVIDKPTNLVFTKVKEYQEIYPTARQILWIKQ